MRILVFFSLLVGQASLAWAQSSGAVSLTIYNDNLALIRDQRMLNLDKGVQTIPFKGVSAKIIAPSALLKAEDVFLIEQNFDFDLLTPESLLKKSLGQTVTLTRTNPATGEAITEQADILSVQDGFILGLDGRIEAFRQLQANERLIFPKVPDNLRAEPTLSMTVEADKSGSVPAELSYLSEGLGWNADYVAVLNAEETELALQGLVTLTNQSGTAYKQAQIQLVAGKLNRARPAPRPRANVEELVVTGSRIRRTADVAEEELLDFHLYTLPVRTDLSDNQTKQVGFLSAPSVAVEKQYISQWGGFQTREEPQSADVRLIVENKQEASLGKPMPAGVFRVYKNDTEGRSQFVGEERINHTPENQSLKIKLGEAFDVTVTPTNVLNEGRRRGLAGRKAKVTQRYTVANAKNEAVEVWIIQNVYGDRFEVTEETLSSEQINARQLQWAVLVPPKGETVLEFSLDIQR